MRPYLRLIMLFTVILGGAYLAACHYAKNSDSQVAQTINTYSVLAPKETKYVKVDNTKAKDHNGYGNYEYSLTSFDKDGAPQKVKFTGTGKLKQGHYLKLKTKGTHVKTYQEVTPDHMPGKAAVGLAQQ